MRSGIAKLAAAAAIVVVGLLAVLFWGPSGSTAYALEQTLAALHSVRTLHMKDLAPDQDEPKEFWIECDEAGNLLNVRLHMPAWDSPADGPKEVVWHSGKAEVWFKAKGVVVTVNEKDKIAQLLEMVVVFDPKRALERVMRLQEEGRAQVQIEQPSNKADPIKVTVTYKGDQDDIQDVMMVNQATLLLESTHRYRLVNGQSQFLGADEFLSYNQPIDPSMFVLDNLPAGVMRVDMTRQDVGLARGDLTEQEMAEKVAKEFFEALVAEDYDKAGRLMGGLTGDALKTMLTGKKFMRIVSIGKAGPHPNPATQGWAVSCEVELQKDGQTSVVPFPALGVRPVQGQGDRWAVFGGF